MLTSYSYKIKLKLNFGFSLHLTGKQINIPIHDFIVNGYLCTCVKFVSKTRHGFGINYLNKCAMFRPGSVMFSVGCSEHSLFLYC